MSIRPLSNSLKKSVTTPWGSLWATTQSRKTSIKKVHYEIGARTKTSIQVQPSLDLTNLQINFSSLYVLGEVDRKAGECVHSIPLAIVQSSGMNKLEESDSLFE